jgi:hypothetical protein
MSDLIKPDPKTLYLFLGLKVPENGEIFMGDKNNCSLDRGKGLSSPHKFNSKILRLFLQEKSPI